MATAVFFHAHPDDEAIATGGTMRLLARASHRVVVVCATDGARGKPAGPDGSGGPEGSGDDPPDEGVRRGDDLDGGGAGLAAVREAELRASAQILGAHRVEMLGYADSGMEGAPANEDPECFWQADFMEATGRLVRLVRRRRPEVMTIYDPFGGYGHPDHIQVHRVGMAASSAPTT